MMYEFLIGYVLLAAISLRSRQMLRVSLAMFGNWILNTGFVLATGNYTPWLWFAATDFIAAAIVLREPAGRWQGAIGWTYIAQILMHFVFGMMQVIGKNPDGDAYLDTLTAVAVAQMALVTLWGIGGGLRAVHSRLLRGRPHRSLPHGVAGLEP